MLKTILIVDDSPTDRLYIRLLLGKDNYNFIEANNGETGLRLAIENRPDIVIVDNFMPGLSGEQMIIKLQSLWPEALAIMVTGLPQGDYQKKYRGVDVVNKLNAVQDLPNLVKYHLKEKLEKQTEVDIIKRYYKISGELLAYNASRLDLEDENSE